MATRTSDYLHGYSSGEQDRLYRQARFLEESVYDHIDFSKAGKVIEVACGVGAQTEILLKRFPKLFVQGIDASKAQIGRARQHLKKPIKQGRVALDVGDARKLPYESSAFDGAFVCWFLEHLGEPIPVLKEIRRVLKPGGLIYCSEVLNATFYVHPYSPATLQYWFAYNDQQWMMKGDPFVGAKLANYLLDAGYQNVSTEVKISHFDNRMPKKRAEAIEEWTALLLSGAPRLIKAKRTTVREVKQMKEELTRLKDDPDSVFFNSWVQAKAQAF